jgi:hypothetical protein
MQHFIFQVTFLLLIMFVIVSEGQHKAAQPVLRGRPATRRVNPPVELVHQMSRDTEEMKRCLEVDHHNNAKEFASQLIYKKADLNRDGHADYLVNPANACSQIGANNVPLFAYLWESGRYRMVLEDGGLDIRAGRTLSKGHLTVTIEAHASGNDVDITHYKFERTTYKPFRCLTRKYDDARQRFARTVRRPCEE